VALVKSILLNSNDNVSILTKKGKLGDTAYVEQNIKLKMKLRDEIQQWHKIAVRDIEKNKEIIKYGQIIGYSSKKIIAGEHVHNHNIYYSEKILFSNNLFDKNSKSKIFPNDLPDTFNGYLRKDKRAGIRNYFIVVSSSNCSATVVKKICNNFSNKDFSNKNIDEIIPVCYSGGCALAKDGDTYKTYKKTILGWLNNPNVVGALIIGLGCEVITEKGLFDSYNDLVKIKENRIPIEYFTIQESGGANSSIKSGIKKIENFINNFKKPERTIIPVSKLIIGLNCGGSDALSGITANPALGFAGDYFVDKNGTIVLGEYPECNGTENHLLQRCVNTKDKKKLKEIFSWWQGYVKKNKVNLDNNLSLGNKEGGISTILEKSLGAIIKGGTSNIKQVLKYSEHITKHGLIFMDTPGYDPVSVTGLVAGGCQIIAFTTGRGSLYGCSIAPTIKISSNTSIFDKMKNDIDINAGKILEGIIMNEVGKEIYKYIIKIANGEKTKSEKNGIGWEEFVPWNTGETL
jgi:altronate hydrolase